MLGHNIEDTTLALVELSLKRHGTEVFSDGDGPRYSLVYFRCLFSTWNQVVPLGLIWDLHVRSSREGRSVVNFLFLEGLPFVTLDKSVNIVPGCRTVVIKVVGPNSHNWSIFFVQIFHGQVQTATI